MRGSVTVFMAAPAALVWDLVADVTRIGEFSPETFEAEWLPGGRVLNTWRYQFAPRDGGTDVTESFELPSTLLTRLYWLLAGWARGRANLAGMRATLERLRTTAEAG
jgi:Polyketide cyclase / dehydrase and lipid transport